MSGRQSAATERALKLVASGKMNARQAALHCGIAVPTIYRALKQERAKALTVPARA